MPFILNTSILSGVTFSSVDAIIAERGRYIQIEWAQDGANQDMEIYGYAIRVVPGEGMAQE